MSQTGTPEVIEELFTRDKVVEVLGSQPLTASAIAAKINAKYPGTNASGQGLAKILNSLKLQGKVVDDGAEAGSKKWHRSVLPVDRIAEAIASTDEVQSAESYRRLADMLWKKTPSEVRKLLNDYADGFEAVQKDKQALQERLTKLNQL